MPPNVARQGDTAAPNATQLTIGAFVCIALAVGVLPKHWWGPLLESYFTVLHVPSPVQRAVPLYIGVDIGWLYVLWIFRGFLGEGCHYPGANRPILVLISLLSIDVIALLSLLVSHADGFQLHPFPLGLYGLVLSYPHFAYFSLGVALIAFGYSLLRAPDDLGGLLRPYAQIQIVTGAMLAAPPLAGLWPFTAAAGHVLMAVMLFNVSVDPTTRLAAARKA